MKSENNLIQGRIKYLRDSTDFVSSLFDSVVGYAIVAADFDGNIIAYNEGAHQIYGYAPDEVIGKKLIEDFFPEEFIRAGGLEHIVSELIEKGRVSRESELFRKDGTRFPAHLLLTLTRDKNSQVVGFVEIVQDLTAQKRADELLKASEEVLHRIIESNADSMLIVDEEGIIRFMNHVAEELFARSEKELLGSYFGFPTVAGERTEIEIVRPVAYGTAVVEMRITDIEWQGRKAYLAALRDITARKIIEDKLAFLSLRDQLTGLYNRHFFVEEMRRFGGGRFDPVAIIMCDVDGLKIVNDALGHKSGDELIVSVSNILRSATRESDVVARVGGDEFAILLPNTPLNFVEIIVNRFKECIARFNKNNTEKPVSVSVGYAVKIGPSPDIFEVYKKSDDNMYADKRHKRVTAQS